MKTEICDDHDAIAREAAHRVASLIQRNNSLGRKTVLGLATGSTPIPLYEELIRLHKNEGLDFSRVVTFNLDEYYGLPANLSLIHI